MSQSLSNVIIHIVFSTKDRASYLSKGCGEKLHAYLATVVRSHDCQCIRVGGVADHVHLAVRLGRSITQAKLLEMLKSSSSKWLKKSFPSMEQFAWQRGYGSFSVAPSQLDQLVSYIDNQEKHHESMSFQDEYRLILKKYSISFDERYVWD